MHTKTLIFGGLLLGTLPVLAAPTKPHSTKPTGAKTAPAAKPKPPAHLVPAAIPNLPILTQPVSLRASQGQAVTGLALSRDGHELAVATGGKNVELFDLATRKLIRQVAGTPTVQQVAFSPTGSEVATSSDDFRVALNSTTTGAQRIAFSLGVGGANQMDWSANGKLLAVAHSNEISLYDTATTKLLAHDFGNVGVGAQSAVLSPDGSRVAVGWTNRSVTIYATSNFGNPTEGTDIPTLKPLFQLEGHDAPVLALAWSPDGKTLFSGDEDGQVGVWDAATGKSRAFWMVGNTPVTSLAVAPSGQSVAVSLQNDANLQLWDVAKNKVKLSWNTPAAAQKIAFTPDGKTVIAGDAKGAVTLAPVTSLAWAKPAPETSVDFSQPVVALSGTTDYVSSLAWSPDGKTLVAVGSSARIVAWNLTDGQRIRIGHSHRLTINHAVFSPDSKLLATSSDSGVEIADVRTGHSLWRREGNAVVAGFSPDGATLWVTGLGGSGNIMGLEAQTGKPLKIIGKLADLGGTLNTPLQSALSPDGSKLAISTRSAGQDNTVTGTVGVWDIATAKLLWKSPFAGQSDGLAWSKDGKTLVLDDGDHADAYGANNQFTAGKAGVRFLSAEDGSALPTSHMDLEAPAKAIALSPNGKTWAIALENKDAQLWDAEGKSESITWAASTQQVQSWAWSPDGKRLAAASGSVVQIFRVP